MSEQQPTDLVAVLRELSGPRYPDDICGKRAMGEAADEIERLRAEVHTLSTTCGHCGDLERAWAAVAAARREGIEAAALVASRRAAERHSTVAVCHSDRSKKHMQIRADEAGQLVADIRALMEDGR